MQRKCLVCVICNSNSIHSFIFKLSITIAHIEDVHLLFFAHLKKKSFWGSWIYTFFLIKMLRLLFCVICNSNSFHSLLCKLCIIVFIHWTWAIPFLCTFDIYIFLNSGLLNLNIIPPEMLRAIPEKNTWEGKTAGDIFFYGWLVRKVFKLYGSLVFDQI